MEHQAHTAIGRVYTIGHGGLTPNELAQHLTRLEIQYVADVRSAPYSRYQPDFSRAPLEAFLGRHGLKYVFMGDDIGGRPEDPDCYTDGKVDYARCRTTASFQRGIERIRTAYGKGLCLCLLCSESKPWQCHRSKLIGAMLADEGIDVQHILADGSLRSQEEVIRELTGGQVELFGDHFVSRKAYR